MLSRGGEGSAGRRATFDMIQNAAFLLFATDGYERVTADEIASAAGVSVRTFYRYFSEGKEGVVLTRARSEVDDLVNALRCRPPQEGAWVALREAVTDVVEQWSSATPELSNPSYETSSLVYAQIAALDGILLSRLVGERVLLIEPMVQLLALRMAVDPVADVRPGLMAHAVNAAITAAWFTTRADPEQDWLELVIRSLDTLERSFGRRPAKSSGFDGRAA